MAPYITIALFLAAAPFAGTVEIEGLGLVALPPGEWMVEVADATPRMEEIPDCYIFRRVGIDWERLTILRYRPEIAPGKLVNLADTMADSFNEGVPIFMQSEVSLFGGYVAEQDAVVELQRAPKDWDAKVLVFSDIHTSSNRPTWMSHVVLAGKDGAAFGYLHSSTRVLSPEAVDEVWLDSRLTARPIGDSARNE